MIAIVYPQLYGVGGIARYLDSLLRYLPPLQPRPVVITGDENRTARSYPHADIVHIPGSSGRANLFTWGAKVRRLLERLHREGRIRGVNFHWPPLIPGLLLPSDVPLVLTAHTTYLGMSGRFTEKREFESQWNAASVCMKTWMEKRILASARHVITLTAQGRQEILRYGFGGSVSVIPNGADTDAFSPDPSVRKDIDVLFSGRIERRKGSRAIPEICRRLVAVRPGVQICIVGYGDDQEWLGNELRGLAKNVTLTGQVPFGCMADYYRRSRMYVSPSYYEGLPGTCLEAMATALPVVVWDLPFYRDLVVDGQTGAIAAVNDWEDLVGKMVRMLDDDACSGAMGKTGRSLLERRYDWRTLAVEITDVLTRNA